MVEYYVDDSVLRHYGVQGMKWGVRKDVGAHKVVAKYAKTAYGVASRELRAMQIKKQFKNWNFG